MSERTRTLAVAGAIRLEAHQPHHQVEIPDTVSKSGTPTPRFSAESALFIRVDCLSDLPSGEIYFRIDPYTFRRVRTDRIPMEKQADLIQAIADGRVYVLHDLRIAEFEEIDPHWPTRIQVRDEHTAQRDLRHATMHRRASWNTPAHPPTPPHDAD